MAIQIHPILNFGRFFSAVNDEERDAGSCDPDNVNPISLADIAKIYGTRSIICAQVRKRRGQYDSDSEPHCAGCRGPRGLQRLEPVEEFKISQLVD